jgi:zinc protease
MTPYFTPDGSLHPCDLAPGLHTALLPDGLKVIIKEDHRTPVAVCNVWVRVGSNREPEKLRGWSHGIEHMLFKGTQSRDEGDFAREVASAGGSTNAGTGYETTNYHITLPADNLAVAVDILGDALLGSVFDPASLDAERQVLVHENHMYDDIPFGFGVTWRWGMKLTFDRSPYRHPIGGSDENLLERDRQDILAFYRSAYRPDNMTVVVVGDVDPETAFQLVRDKFQDRTDAGPRVWDPELTIVNNPLTEEPHDRCRIRVEHGDIKRAYCKLFFPGPGEKDDLRPVLSVVRRILSDGRSCRVYRQVQENLKLVDDFAVMTETGPREGVLIVDLETSPERLPAAINAVAEILADLAANGCTERELDRARVRVSRSFLFGAETVQGQASTMGYHEAIDDLPGAFNFPAKVAAITSDDVARFCREVFRLSDLSCVVYLPEGTDPLAFGIPTDPDHLEALLTDTLNRTAPAPAAKLTVKPGSPAVHLSRDLAGGGEIPFETTRLDNGVTFCYRVDRSLPIVAMTLSTIGGATDETPTNAGLSTLTQVVQIKGTGDLSSEQVHEALEGEGASLSPRTERDFTGLFLSGLSTRLDRALELTGQLAVAPSFPPEEIEQEKRLALEQLASLEDNPFQAAVVKLRELLYGNHPYGRPLPGTATSLPNLTREHLLARHRQGWTAANLRIVASGSFDPEQMAHRLQDVLADLPAGHPVKRPDPGAARIPQEICVRRLEKDQNQSVVLVGWPGPMTPDADRVPLMMMKEILNGQAGRLFESLRNRRSLCYNTGTLSTAGFGQGMFLGYVLTSPETENDARGAMLEELALMTSELVDSQEFERARAKLVGNLLISAQSNSARVIRAGQDLLFDRDANDLPRLVDLIRACGPEDVRAVARALITPEQHYQVTIGPSRG